jgi:predicted RNase H-like nuclease (RuvC/YqgF family)
MSLIEALTNPVVVSAVVAATVALATKGLDLHLKSRKQKDTTRVSDRELLSKDEKDFRLTIIKQLQQCSDMAKELQRENHILKQNEIRMAARISRLETEVGMMEDVLRAKNIPLPFTRHEEDGTHP